MAQLKLEDVGPSHAEQAEHRKVNDEAKAKAKANAKKAKAKANAKRARNATRLRKIPLLLKCYCSYCSYLLWC